MSNWLHKATLRYEGSQDPPLDQQGDWIKNPTLPAGVESWADVIVDGDTVRAPNEAELAVQNANKLAAAKVAKIAAIDARTEYLIEHGSVVINGESISTRLTQQASLLGIKASHDAGLPTFPRELSAIDGRSYTCPNAADFVRIAALVLYFVETAKASGRALRADVLACTTIAEVEAITDGRA